MNLSGNSVIKAASYYKIMPQEIVVIHDDMDLLPGQIKVKRGGGSGGHNGLKSIDAHIGSDYNRIRIGVGHPQGRGEAVVSHVLSRFSRADKEQLNEEIRLIAENIPVMVLNFDNIFGTAVFFYLVNIPFRHPAAGDNLGQTLNP